jgi:hypothetical protein
MFIAVWQYLLTGTPVSYKAVRNSFKIHSRTYHGTVWGGKNGNSLLQSLNKKGCEINLSMFDIKKQYTFAS